MPTGNKLIDSGAAALSRHIGQYRKRRRLQLFTGRVSQALAELGLVESSFDVRVKDLLSRVCIASDEKMVVRDTAAIFIHKILAIAQ